MNPVTHVNLSGTVTRLSVQTDAKGAVVIAYVEEDTDGQPLSPEEFGHAWLRLSPQAIEHVAYRYAALISPAALYALAADMADRLDRQNGGCDHAELAGRVLKVGEEFGAAIAAWNGATGRDPDKDTHTLGDVAAELADVVIAALTAITSLGYHAESVVGARVAHTRETLPDLVDGTQTRHEWAVRGYVGAAWPIPVKDVSAARLKALS